MLNYWYEWRAWVNFKKEEREQSLRNLVRSRIEELGYGVKANELVVDRLINTVRNHDRRRF